MLEKYLQSIGLTDKEASIYLSLLQVDSTTALELSKKTGINRSTVYVTIESLSKKGLVSETTVGKKTQFHAEAPERLETYIEQRKNDLDEQSHRLKDIIPEIKSLQRETGERPVVKYFEGREGILSMLEEVFGKETEKTSDPMYVLYPEDTLKDLFTQKEREKYRTLRLTRHIHSKALYTSSTAKASDATSDRILIDKEKYPFFCDITVYKDRVSISILGKKISGVFVQSKDFANTMKSLFKMVFEDKHII